MFNKHTLFILLPPLSKINTGNNSFSPVSDFHFAKFCSDITFAIIVESVEIETEIGIETEIEMVMTRGEEEKWRERSEGETRKRKMIMRNHVNQVSDSY